MTIPTFDMHAYINQNLHPDIPNFQTTNDFTHANHTPIAWTDTITAFFQQAESLHWSRFSVCLLVLLLIIAILCKSPRSYLNISFAIAPLH